MTVVTRMHGAKKPTRTTNNSKSTQKPTEDPKSVGDNVQDGEVETVDMKGIDIEPINKVNNKLYVTLKKIVEDKGFVTGKETLQICQDLLDGAKAKIENNKEKPAKWVSITQNYYLLVKMKPSIA